MISTVVPAIGLVLAGILAGEEFIVRWGVQPALSRLSDHSHVEARIALVKRLKIVVPAIMVPTALLAVATLLVAGGGAGLAWRWAGMIALVAFLLFSFLGTVPINIKVNDWDADAPPAEWKAVVARWQAIDVYRSTAAVVAFVCFTIAFALQLS
ncbi:anthrone oxygenase family protein [Microterricola viridarii]|uniref:DUF1772 domain-containing protein n=1 Tax=Microterricola viridarii TaxID=412690 RepID=A0A0Y0MQL0_9MICO|nr:DUF1772 domain-containing protein [Microterricola viridarii]AMB58028.1 hypothetical protein AWU67_03140 [Microterricola viridarii]